MKKYSKISVLSLLIALNICVLGNNKNTILGNIKNKTENKALAGAVVFLSQTCYSAVSDNEGNYKIENIIPGNYQVVICAKGYIPAMSSMYIDKDNTYPLNVSLEPLTSADLIKYNSPKNSDFESDYLIFERIFIGQTAFMGSCKVENPEAMNFNWNKGVIEGKSNGFVIFIHKKFGYKIRCLINDFIYDTKQLFRRLDYSIYFEELKPEDKDELEDWQNYRKEAYEGSINHFMWAFRNDKMNEEEYAVFALRSLGPEAMMSDGMDSASDANNQFQNKIFTFSEVSLGDIDQNLKMFTINGFLKVVHKPRSYSKETSFLQVPGQTVMMIDKHGWVDIEQPYNSYGKWSKNGISNMLPKDYRAKYIDKEIKE